MIGSFAASASGGLFFNNPADNVVCRDSFVDLFRSTAYVGVASTSSNTLASSTAVSATSVTLVGAVTAFEVGELIYVDSKSDNFETTIVTAVDTGTKTLTVSPALSNAHDAGVLCGQAWHNATHVFGSGDPNTAGFYGRWVAGEIDFDPGPTIVVIGDSWCEPGAGNDHDDLATNPRADFNEFRTSITDRYPGTTVYHIPGGSGDDMTEQLDRWSQVVALQPSTVIHFSGFMNDLAGSRTEAAVKADCLDMFNRCKALGSFFMMAGVAPYSADESYAASMKTAVETYVNALT